MRQRRRCNFINPSPLAAVLLPAGSIFLTVLCASEPGEDRSLREEAPAIRRVIPELDAARQMILVVSDSWDASTASLQTFERDRVISEWQPAGIKCAAVVGRNGMAWGIGAHGSCTSGPHCKREGDGRAPAGVFRLSTVFGYANASQSGLSRMPYVSCTSTLKGVDDPASRYYNRLVDLLDVGSSRDWRSAEDMLRADELYRWGVVVEHNHEAVPRFGSCIFLHLWKSRDTGTAGCTAMAAEHITKIVRWLDASRHPCLVQLPVLEYTTWQPAWRLP